MERKWSRGYIALSFIQHLILSTRLMYRHHFAQELTLITREKRPFSSILFFPPYPLYPPSLCINHPSQTLIRAPWRNFRLHSTKGRRNGDFCLGASKTPPRLFGGNSIKRIFMRRKWRRVVEMPFRPRLVLEARPRFFSPPSLSFIPSEMFGL